MTWMLPWLHKLIIFYNVHLGYKGYDRKPTLPGVAAKKIKCQTVFFCENNKGKFDAMLNIM